MEASEIRNHWTDWATKYGMDLRATTRAATPKVLEIDALMRRFRAIADKSPATDILEVGCGNGVNCFALAEGLPNAKFDGVDFVPEMIDAARERSKTMPIAPPRFFVGDVLKLDAMKDIKRDYDIVFTDRCLINLNQHELQLSAVTQLAKRVRPGGHLVLIENSTSTYGRQNRCREVLGMQPRTPASFNLFFDEAKVRPHAESLGLELVHVEDFSSLHDLVLYALVPAMNGGTVDYEHPLVKIATNLSLGIFAATPNAFGDFGQNRLFHWRRA
jgi:ubiquinone/menaquinone biosynthesis C-methylase UbiE